MSKPLSITVDAARTTGKLYPFWTVMNCNRPHVFTDPAFIERLPRERPFISQINAVYLLGGRQPHRNNWYLGENPDGTIRTDFTGMIEQLRGMVDNGYTPWPVLDNVPYEMSDPPAENAFGNTAPPKDEALWEQYVEAALRAMVAEFGRDMVGSWWFRVGTEPDLIPGHWSGTRQQYVDHYRATVRAFERVIPEATIGPGNTLNPIDGEYGAETHDLWGLDLIDYLGAENIRMDWFSWSWYGRISVTLDFFDQAVDMVRERLNAYTQYRDLPLIIGEFAVLHDEHSKRLFDGDATEWGASFYASIARRTYDLGLQQVYEWTHATLEVLQPRGRVISFLKEMSGGDRLAVTAESGETTDCGAIAGLKNGDLYILLYNHHKDREPKVDEVFSLTVSDPRMKAGDVWTLSERTIDHDHGVWVYENLKDVDAAGVEAKPDTGRYEPQPYVRYWKEGVDLFKKHREKYRAIADNIITRANEKIAADNGGLSLDIPMPGHSVRLLKLSPPA